MRLTCISSANSRSEGPDVSGLELTAHDSFAENICDLPVERFIVPV